jgi:manganese efflux pump family protein
VTFGVMTVVMSFIGLRLGRAVASVIRIRSDLLSGISLVVAAIVLPIVFA